MKTTIQYLDAYKAKLHLASDYAAAKALGITRAAVSKYRNGHGGFDDETAVRLAEALEINPLEVIAAANGERARDDNSKRFWERVWGKSTGAATTASVAAVFILGLAAAPSPANSTPLELDNGALVHVMSNRRRAANDPRRLAA